MPDGKKFMNPKIPQLVKHNKVTILYEGTHYTDDNGNVVKFYIDCFLKPFYHLSLGVMAIGGTEDIAIDRAVTLQNRVKELEKTLGHPIESPSLEEQQYENGYVHKNVTENTVVSFKRIGNDFWIQSVKGKDKYGFTYHENPKPPLETNSTSKRVGKVEDIHGYNDIKDYLKLDTIDLEGGELWTWDDISFLCGGSGLMVVKDGLVVKSLGLWRS